jgi:hypothetical protein
MAVIEVVTFRLTPGANEEEFLAADQDFQTACLYVQRGLLRRTTARGVGDEWLVVTVWGSSHDADAAAVVCRDDPGAGRWAAFVDPPSLNTRRDHTLD